LRDDTGINWAVRLLPGRSFFVLRDFFVFVVDGRFCRGFCENMGAERGFLMVIVWWIGGRTWCVDGCFSASKNTPLF
jgi:hypothetical protein